MKIGRSVNFISLSSNVRIVVAGARKYTAIAGSQVPDGGFLPIPTPAELSDAQSEKPHFWGSTQVAASGLMMYMEPRVVSASIVIIGLYLTQAV